MTIDSQLSSYLFDCSVNYQADKTFAQTAIITPSVEIWLQFHVRLAVTPGCLQKSSALRFTISFDSLLIASMHTQIDKLVELRFEPVHLGADAVVSLKI